MTTPRRTTTKHPAAPTRLVRSRRRDAYETILSAIVFGDLAPASSVDEKRIVQEFGLGLAAVRDALNRLALEHMIVRHARIKTYVPDLSLRELQEVFEARGMLEGACVALAANRATSEEIAALRAAFEGFEELIEGRRFRELVARDQMFHRTLAAASRNRQLERTLVLLHNNASRYWYYGIQRIDSALLSADVKAHLDVVDAIERRDVEGATHEMRTLLGHFPTYMASMLMGSIEGATIHPASAKPAKSRGPRHLEVQG